MQFYIAGADPGFSVEGRGPVLGGRGRPTRELFSENVCEKERIGSRRGGLRRKILYVDPPMYCYCCLGIPALRQDKNSGLFVK